MLNKLKKSTLQKKINKSLSERNLSERNSSLVHLGFLVDESIFNDFDKLNQFGIELGVQEKDIKHFTFVETGRKIPSLSHNQITNRNFGWNGEIKNQNAKEFLGHPFDVLISFYEGKNKFLDLLTAESQAKFKIGFNDCDQRLFDLVLGVDLQKFEQFKIEVSKYLRALNKI